MPGRKSWGGAREGSGRRPSTWWRQIGACVPATVYFTVKAQACAEGLSISNFLNRFFFNTPIKTEDPEILRLLDLIDALSGLPDRQESLVDDFHAAETEEERQEVLTKYRAEVDKQAGK